MRKLIGILTSIVFACLVGGVSTASQPNIVIILTDDQGWGDLRVNGNTHLATPNIDSLARDGATLENFYVCEVCAPTRVEFLIGSRPGWSRLSTKDQRSPHGRQLS